MIKIRILLIRINDPASHPNLPAGLHRISEIMHHVLARYRLSIDDDSASVSPANAAEAFEVLVVMISYVDSDLPLGMEPVFKLELAVLTDLSSSR